MLSWMQQISDSCIDKGVMIAYTGYLMHMNGMRLGIDECDVT